MYYYVLFSSQVWVTSILLQFCISESSVPGTKHEIASQNEQSLADSIACKSNKFNIGGVSYHFICIVLNIKSSGLN